MAPDNKLGHAVIRHPLKEDGIGVAAGEHAHAIGWFKQLLQGETMMERIRSVQHSCCSHVYAL